jgi:DNA-binding MarR family transcriptional regulator
LQPEPKNITDISEETGVDRKSVIRYLEALTNHKYIHELENDGRTREFYIESTTKSTDPVEDIPEWSHKKSVEESRIKMMKEKSSNSH